MLFIFSPFHLFTFKELGSYGVKPNAEVALAIFSPFHPFTFKGVSHFFTFSPFHLFTFKSLFTLKNVPYHTFISSQNTHPTSAPCLARRRT